MIFLLFLITFFVLGILFILTLQNTLKAVSSENRQLRPELVWLLLIPGFNLIWLFVIVSRIPKSIQQEFLKRDIQSDTEALYYLGLAFSFMITIGIVLSQFSPQIGGLLSWVGLILWIVYWIQVNGFRKKLQLLPREYYSDSEIFGNIKTDNE